MAWRKILLPHSDPLPDLPGAGDRFFLGKSRLTHQCHRSPSERRRLALGVHTANDLFEILAQREGQFIAVAMFLLYKYQ